MNFTCRRFLLVKAGENKNETRPSTGIMLPNRTRHRIAATLRFGRRTPSPRTTFKASSTSTQR